jgi:hypothetical protein
VRDEVEKWLMDRPVTQVQFLEAQQQARVTLAVAGDELFDVFRATALKQANALGPIDDATWDRVHDEFVSRVGPAAGRALAKGNAAPLPGNVARGPVAIPASPPLGSINRCRLTDHLRRARRGSRPRVRPKPTRTTSCGRRSSP